MKVPDLAISCKIFENCILKPTSDRPSYATNWDNFGRGPLKDYYCEVWSKSSDWFESGLCLIKNVDL